MPLFIVDLSQFEVVTEDNKIELITWLKDQLEVLEDPNYNYADRNVNRVFGDPSQDDIDVARIFMGRFLVTLQQMTLTQK